MISVDVGGTFTDVVAMEAGKVRVKKVPTTIEARERAVLEGLSYLGVKDKRIFNHASTAGLNAILTRELPKIGFLTTMGHRDMLDMGRLWRPLNAQTNPHWRRSFGDASKPLVPRYLRRGIRQRTLNSGEVLVDLDIEQARSELEVLKRQDVKGLAICLINAYANGEHERKLRELAIEVLGDIPISISSEVSPLAKEYTRASTTVVDTFMKLIFGRYTEKLIKGIEKLGFCGSTNLSDCAAMLIPWKFSMQKPFRNIYSGPAAGTVSSAYFGKVIGENRLLCCDIGGTSCDISLVRDGKPTVHTEFEIEHDLVVNTLANEIFTIGAGGGSIVHVSPTGQLTIGPDSVGANPGPACYNRGGDKLTVTDLFLLLGILDAKNFLGGEIPLDIKLAEKAVERLDIKLTNEEKVRYSYQLTLYNIQESIANVCLSLGIDPRDYSLIAYGSGGPMIIPSVMEELGVRRIIVPPNPGAFSALGLLSSDLVFTNERTAYTILTQDKADSIDQVYRELESEMFNQIGKQNDFEIERTFDGMYSGQTWTTALVSVPSGKISKETIGQMISNFNSEYKKRAGNSFDYIPIMGVNYRSRIIIKLPKVEYNAIPKRTRGKPEVKKQTKLSYLKNPDGSQMIVNEYEREGLQCGDVIIGPAIIREPVSTTYIVSGQKGTIGLYGEINIKRAQDKNDKKIN